MVILSGTGFDTDNIENNQVWMGDKWPCIVTQVNETQLTCVPYSQTPVGTYVFSLNIINKGFADITSLRTTITFDLVASSFSPTTGGTGGLYI